MKKNVFEDRRWMYTTLSYVHADLPQKLRVFCQPATICGDMFLRIDDRDCKTIASILHIAQHAAEGRFETKTAAVSTSAAQQTWQR